jgi:hypothetical protein
VASLATARREESSDGIIKTVLSGDLMNVAVARRPRF